MNCKKCGNEIFDEAVICPHCGCETENNKKDVNDSVNGGLIFLAILIPIVGVVLGCINLSKGQKNAGKIYLIVGIIAWAIWFAIQSMGSTL